MKKNVKITLICLLAALVAFFGVVTVYAETIYHYFGFSYMIVNNYSVSVCGWDNSSPSVIIPEQMNDRDVVSVNNHGFSNNTYITDISFDEAVWMKRIGIFAFNGCTSLSSVTIPTYISIIGMGAFQNCSSLETVNYDADISYVPEQCFYNCTALQNVQLSDSVTSIEAFAFADCPNLAYIEIPSTVESIADTAFQNDNVTLGVYYNSDAHLFALDNEIEYVILDPENIPPEPPTEAPTDAPTEAPTDAPTEPGYILGDADGDGEITTIDVTYIQRYDVLMDLPTPINEKSADVDGDGEITIIDATYIQRFLAQFIMEYPVGQWFPLT